MSKSRRADEHHGAQHADGILEEPHRGIANRSDHPRAEILEAVHVVDDRERADVVEERVDREVAPERILFRRAERVVAMDHAIVRTRPGEVGAFRLRLLRPRIRGIGRVLGCCLDHRVDARRHFRRIDLAPERRHLDGLGTELHMRETESSADDPAVAEQLLDLMRMGRRSNIKILRAASQQEIAHTAAHQIRDVVVFVQAIQDLEGIGIDVSPRDSVVGSRNDGRVHHHREL